jgi:hypothetical protein
METRLLTGVALFTAASVIAKRSLEQRPVRRRRGAAWPAPAARHAAAVAAAALPVPREPSVERTGVVRALHAHLAAWHAVRIGGTMPHAN